MGVVSLLPSLFHQFQLRQHVLLVPLHLRYLILLELYPLVQFVRLLLEPISLFLQPLHYHLSVQKEVDVIVREMRYRC